jgi:hypothetical protein
MMLRLVVFLGVLLAPATAWAVCEPPYAVLGTVSAFSLEQYANCVARESQKQQEQIKLLARTILDLEQRLLNLEARSR